MRSMEIAPRAQCHRRLEPLADRSASTRPDRHGALTARTTPRWMGAGTPHKQDETHVSPTDSIHMPPGLSCHPSQFNPGWAGSLSPRHRAGVDPPLTTHRAALRMVVALTRTYRLPRGQRIGLVWRLTELGSSLSSGPRLARMVQAVTPHHLGPHWPHMLKHTAKKLQGRPSHATCRGAPRCRTSMIAIRKRHTLPVKAHQLAVLQRTATQVPRHLRGHTGALGVTLSNVHVPPRLFAVPQAVEQVHEGLAAPLFR